MKLNIDKVKMRMKERELSIEDLAKLMSVHKQTVHDTLVGKTGKTFRVIQRLSKALKVDEKDLIL